MAQPTSLPAYSTIIAAGTTVLAGGPTTIARVILPGTYVGTVELYDSPTAAGTAAGNLITSFAIPTLTTPRSVEIGARTRYGLTYVATGTPTMSVIWGD